MLLSSSCICNQKSFFKPIIKYQKEDIFKAYEKAIIGKCITCGLLKTVVKPKRFNPQISHIDNYQNKKNQYIRLFSKIVTKIRQIKNKGTVLDVGCSFGILMELLEKDYQVFGIEPNINAYKITKNKFKNKVFLGKIKDFIKKNKKKKFDIIIYNHVLEHIENINQEFLMIKKLIKKGGLLVIGVPNVDNIIFFLRKKYWEGLMVNEHIWHFSKKYLINYLNKQGFKIIDIQFINDKREDYPFLKKIYFYFLNFINKILKTGENVVIYGQKI